MSAFPHQFQKNMAPQRGHLVKLKRNPKYAVNAIHGSAIPTAIESDVESTQEAGHGKVQRE